MSPQEVISACFGAVIVYQLGWLVRNSERIITRLDHIAENTLDIERVKRDRGW